MSPHRLSYMDLHRVAEDPATAPATGRTQIDMGALITLALLFFFLALFTLRQLVSATAQAPVVPVRSAQAAPVFASPSSAVEDARIEGFRAGLATALEQGCLAPALGMPLGAR